MRVILIPAAATVLIAAGEPGSTPVPVTTLDNPAYTVPPQRWETLEDALTQSENAPLFERYQAQLEIRRVPPDTEQAERMRERARLILGQADCRDRIHVVREASGQLPLTRREPASPEEPLAIYAVHREQDGCSVLVMMGDPQDIRPLPSPQEGPLLQEIPAGQGQ